MTNDDGSLRGVSPGETMREGATGAVSTMRAPMKHDHLDPDLQILEAEIEDGPPRSTLEIRREVMAWFLSAARERDELRARVGAPPEEDEQR